MAMLNYQRVTYIYTRVNFPVDQTCTRPSIVDWVIARVPERLPFLGRKNLQWMGLAVWPWMGQNP